MSVVDPSIKFLQQDAREDAERLSALEGTEAVGFEMVEGELFLVVLVQFTGDIAALINQGFVPQTLAGDIVSGKLPLNRVDAVAAMPQTLDFGQKS